MKIPDKMLNSLVPIGLDNALKQLNWIGSGFLINHKSSVIDEIYLVTNKHVVTAKTQIYLRFNLNSGGTTNKSVTLQLDTVSYWTGHPDTKVDLAVIPLPMDFIQANNLNASAIDITNDCATKQFLIDKNLGEGNDVFVLGYPMGMVDLNNSFPIARKGVLSKIRHMTLHNNNDYIIDVLNFPGNSGGPVFLEQIELDFDKKILISQFYLVGIIKSYIPYQDTAISSQTNRARIIFEENSGLAFAEITDRILETITEFKKV